MTDYLLRSRVADLVHLLEYATIITPSRGDAEQAKRVMLSIKEELLRMTDMTPEPQASQPSEARKLAEEAKRIWRSYAIYYANYRSEPGFENRDENLTRLAEAEDAIDRLASLSPAPTPEDRAVAPHAVEAQEIATVCGENPAPIDADLVGCGKPIASQAEVFRCTDCGVPFHRECAIKHFATDTPEHAQEVFKEQLRRNGEVDALEALYPQSTPSLPEPLEDPLQKLADENARLGLDYDTPEQAPVAEALTQAQIDESYDKHCVRGNPYAPSLKYWGRAMQEGYKIALDALRSSTRKSAEESLTPAGVAMAAGCKVLPILRAIRDSGEGDVTINQHLTRDQLMQAIACVSRKSADEGHANQAVAAQIAADERERWAQFCERNKQIISGSLGPLMDVGWSMAMDCIANNLRMDLTAVTEVAQPKEAE